MRALVATHRSQGDRTDDFDWCIEGELVWIPEACDYDGVGRRDCRCGCARVFGGIASGAGTTTAVIVDLDMTRADYVAVVRRGLESRGWPGDWADGDVTALQSAIAGWEVGEIVERHGPVLGRRFDPRTGDLLAPLQLRPGYGDGCRCGRC